LLHVLDPFRFVLMAVAGWMNQWEYQIIDYLREENRVLREQLGERRLRFNDDQRRRLAVKTKGLTRRLLDEMSPIVDEGDFISLAPETDRAEIRWQWPARARAAAIWDTRWHAERFADILKRHGAEPAAERKKKTTWKEFLAALGTAGGCGFLHGGSADPQRVAAVYGSLLYRAVDPQGGNSRHRVCGQWFMDDPDCQERDRCGRRHSPG
jgi:hypothetical protein